MRKKLFAVIMSAMMMITFMPAMAFAGMWDQETSSAVKHTNWTISGFTGKMNVHSGSTETAYFIYDGQEHTVTLTPRDEAKTWKYVGYTVSKWDATAKKFPTPATVNDAAAPKVKDAGTYLIRGEVKAISGNTSSAKVYTLVLTVAKRPVTVSDNTLTMTKAYDTKPYVLSDADFTIGGYTGNISETTVTPGWNSVTVKTFTFSVDASGNPTFGVSATEVPYWDAQKTVETWTWNDWNNTTAAWKTAHSGLVGSDKLIVGEVKTSSANVGKYHLAITPAVVNPNYYVVSQNDGKFDVEITKAENVAKIASNTLTIKRGSFKAVKFSTTFGTAKLEKVSTGNTKISVKNGKVYVKKGLKKGTYKIQVKCSAAGNNNYTSAARTKTLKIKVK